MLNNRKVNRSADCVSFLGIFSPHDETYLVVGEPERTSPCVSVFISAYKDSSPRSAHTEDN